MQISNVNILENPILASMSTTTITATETQRTIPLNVHTKRYPEPLTPSGALGKFDYEESTPVIGREYPTINLVDDIINAKNADELIRDLAITSKATAPTTPISYLTIGQSPKEASSSSAPKIISPMISTKSLSTASANSLTNHHPQPFTSTLS